MIHFKANADEEIVSKSFNQLEMFDAQGGAFNQFNSPNSGWTKSMIKQLIKVYLINGGHSQAIIMLGDIVLAVLNSGGEVRCD